MRVRALLMTEKVERLRIGLNHLLDAEQPSSN